MNLTIEEPSKVIKMRMNEAGSCKQPRDVRVIPRRKEMVRESGQRLEAPETKDSVGLCDDENCPDGAMFNTKEVSIDFFDLNSTAGKQKRESRGENNRTKGAMHLYGYKTMGAAFERSFIETALKHDVRVKDIRHGEDLIFIYFFTVEDSISFYRQFLPYVELHFSETSDFEQALLLSSSEWASIALLNMNPADSSRGRETCASSSNEKAYLEADSSSEGRTHTSDLHRCTREGCMPCFQYEEPDSGVWNKELPQEAVFEKKIEHFLHLRNFFSKSEVKTMAQSLEMGNIEFIFKNTKELAVGSQSNKVMQEAIGMLSEVSIARVIQNLEYDIAPIAANKHGAYTIQMLISVSKTPLTQRLLSKYFKRFGKFLITHEIGNYTIQKILRFDPDLIFEFFVSKIEDVVRSELGIKVLKRCLEFFPDKKPILVQKAREYGKNLNVLLL
ncbi:hypothetical protein J0A71_05g10630 [Encephalitozoon cuniculi]|nr:hypothetical protein J0A71_05g10630 [Encephalitozoon cuniculi]